MRAEGVIIMKQYIVDAFTDKLFSGNPAAVIITENRLSDVLMQDIAAENNLSETAFAVKGSNKYFLRWFTPGGEIDFCGHATLACAFVILNYYELKCDRVTFETKRGELAVDRMGDHLTMDFPAYSLKATDVTKEMESAVGASVTEAYIDRDLLLVLESEEAVRSLKPDLEKLRSLDGLCVGVTARGTEYDCG